MPTPTRTKQLMKDDSSETPSPIHRPWWERIGLSFSDEPHCSRDLIQQMRKAQNRGLFSLDALAMIEGALTMPHLRVRDVMLARAQVVMLKHDQTLAQILEPVLESGHSRFPVTGEHKDDIVGMLIAKDLLKIMANPEIKWQTLVRPAHVVPESKRLDDLLKEFRANRLHLAIVVDEYGGVAGLVTIEDILEQIVGEIDDEHDDAEEEDFIRDDGNGAFIIKAVTPVGVFNERFNAQFDDEKADTIAGLVMMHLGRLPRRGEEVDLGAFHFRILRSDRRRIHLLSMVRREIEESDNDFSLAH